MYSYGNLQSNGQPGPETAIEVLSSSRVYVVDAIVDSGACMTCIPSRYIDRIGAPIYGRRLFRGAVGSPEYRMTFFVDIRIGEHQFEGLEVVAIDHKIYALIGRDILNQRKITLDGKNRMWSIDFNETNENY